MERREGEGRVVSVVTIVTGGGGRAAWDPGHWRNLRYSLIETMKRRGVINLGNKTQNRECRTYDTCIPAIGLCPLHFIVLIVESGDLTHDMHPAPGGRRKYS